MIKTELCEKLCETLDKEVRLFERLYNSCNQQKDYLVKMDVKDLEQEFFSQDNLCQEIALIEEIRRSIFEDIRKYINKNSEIKLREIIKLTNEPYRTRLNAISARLNEINKEIRRVARLNEELTLQGLEHSKFVLRLLTTGGAEGIRIYNKDGEAKEKEPVVEKRFIDKVV